MVGGKIVRATTTGPTIISSVINTATKTVVYTFSEPIRFKSQADPAMILTDPSGLVKIYTASSYAGRQVGDSEPVSFGGANTAILNGDILTITYTDTLPAGSYLADTWGYTVTDAEGNQLIESINGIFTPDTTIPTAVAAISGNTITYTFSEPVQLKNQVGGTIVTDPNLYASLLGIYTINTSNGNYGPTTVSDVSITSAVLDASNVLTIIYSGTLPAGSYVVDAWGYNIQDLAGNKIAKNDTNEVFSVQALGGGGSIPEDTTKPDLVSVDAAITNNGQNESNTYLKSWIITTHVGETVGSLSAKITENSTLVNGTEGAITITGPLMGGPEATAPYGTFTINGTNVIITPYPGNDVLAYPGTFIFKVAAGTIQDVAGNTNDEISFTLMVSDITPPVITLKGKQVIDVMYGSTYIDEGATAIDNVDGDVTANIITINSVNTFKLGTYIVTYNVSDKAAFPNKAIEVTRTINVTDQKSPVGGNLTVVTKLFPNGITISPINDTYSLPALSLDGADVFQSLSVVITDDNMDTTDTPDVYVDGNKNGKMIYSGSGNIWNYDQLTSIPTFAAGMPHTLVATFKDTSGNPTTLTATFITDNTAPVAGDLTMTTNLQGTITVSPNENVYTISKPLAFNGLDVMTGLSIQITDNDLNTDNVPVTINNILDGEMVYDSNAKIWNYTRQVGEPPVFADGIQTIKASFKDNARNIIPLTLKFTTDTTAPVGSTLTMKTSLFPNGVTATLANDVYTITPALSLDGADVFNSLSVVVTDNNIDTSNVSVYIDGNTEANGYMQYDSVSNVWNYTGQTSRPDFSTGTHSLVATFKDLAGNTKKLTANFTTDNIAPVIKLLGDSSTDITYGSKYIDTGATASDDTNGDITSNITMVNPVDTSVIGQYTVTYNVSDNAKNKAREVTRTVNVVQTKSNVTIICPESEIYTGSAIEPCTATVTGTGLINVTTPVTYKSNTNTGTATASATYLGDDNHSASLASDVTFLITPASSTTTITCPTSVIYTGPAQTPCTATVTGEGLTNITTPVTYTANINVGTANVSAAYTDANHSISSDTKTFEITKATPSIVVTPYSVNYDGKTHSASGTATGVNDEDLSSDLVLTDTNHINAGDYTTDTWSFTDKNGNYTDANGTIHNIISISPTAPSTIIETIKNKDGTESGNIPTETSYTMNIPSVGNVGVVIPADITITGPAGWDGTISAPIITNVTLPTVTGETRTLTSAIELGFSGTKLTFDKAVKITMPDQSGKRVGYTRGGEPFTEITNICGANTQTWADANISIGGECKMNVGSDLIIWTKHFTKFATYTQTINPTLSSGGGSYVPVVVNNTKDEGCLLGNLFSVTTGKSCPKIITTGTSNTIVNNQNDGKVLGAEKYNFTKLLKKGSKGNEVVELQKFLIAAGYDLGTADGSFGNKTKLAVIKYQIVNKLKGDGSVGPATRLLLNK